MKKVLIGVVSLLVLVVGGLVFVWSNLDGIVKDAIQTYGTEATKTTVSVADVKLKLEAGKAEIHGLNVANPKGFSDPDIFKLGLIRAKIDVATVNQNPVIIDELMIGNLAVIYEINKSGTSNVDMLKKNLGVGTAGKSASSDSGSGEELKMVIRKLVIEGASAKVRIAALGSSEKSVKLPRIYLTDVGEKSGGVTAAELAQILSSKLLGNVKSSVAKLGVDKYIGKPADLFKGGLKGAEKLGSGLGGAAGDMGGKAAGAVKGLFGN